MFENHTPEKQAVETELVVHWVPTLGKLVPLADQPTAAPARS